MEGSDKLEMRVLNEKEEVETADNFEATENALPSLMRQALCLSPGPEMGNSAVMDKVRDGPDDGAKVKKEEQMSQHGSRDQGQGSSSTEVIPKKKKATVSIFSLPEEVWELILNELKEDNDLENCCRASTYLDMVLTKRKPVWQFKKVLPHVIEFFDSCDLYDSRLVCKQWKEDLDNFLQDSEYDPQEIDDNDGGLYGFSTTSRIEAFLKKFEDHPGNPFVDRHVYFCDNQAEEGFEDALENLVERFGKYIWKIHARNTYLSPPWFYMYLYRILFYCENLRHFRIDGNVVRMRGVDAAEIETMDRFILDHPLPFVPSLKSLWFLPSRIPFADFPDNIHTVIMQQYAPQLSSLSMCMRSWKDSYAQGLVNLEEAFLLGIPSDRILGGLLLITSPIKVMTLAFTASRIDLLLLLRVIANFPLKSINLFFNIEEEEGTLLVEPSNAESSSAISQIKCPEVFSLSIKHGPKFSYSFLRSFPALKKLSVGLTLPLETYFEGDEEPEGDVQFFKMLREGQMYESNVWSVFPKLEVVQIYDFTFDRRGNPRNLFDYVGTRKEWLRLRQ